MPPKKRDRDQMEVAKNTIYEQMQADHELFLQAFEKPTQIYRFLRTRNLVSPIFLERTVSYMRHRMSRTHKKRSEFRVESMLEKILAAKAKETTTEEFTGFMTLTFTGFFDPNKRCDAKDLVSVETILLKICHKKRKDVSSPIMQTSFGKSDVPCNPDPLNPPTQSTAISVPSDSFNLTNGHLVKSYVLLLRVNATATANNPNSDQPPLHPHSNGVCNGEALSDPGMDGETVDGQPSNKKQRRNGRTQSLDVTSSVMTASLTVPVLTSSMTTMFGAELIVYDKHNRCLLTDGEYELVLQEVINAKGSPRKLSSWESFTNSKEKNLSPFDVFCKCPTLKFHLSWNTVSKSGSVPTPSTFVPAEPNNNNHVIERTTSSDMLAPDVHTKPRRKSIRIFYQFLYNNNTRQQTEAREDLHCPWCSLNCAQLYSLLKHLKLCHSRFIFTYAAHPKGARIDVSINECYDGSYSGNPHELQSQPPGFAFSRNGPVRRTPVTNVMVCRPKRPPPSLSEFLEPDDSEFDGPRPYITGHNRLYHHTITCLPVRPQEIDVDSEGENDPEWLQTKTKLMIDEFTDVNEGEKDLMKMWNLHVMKYGFVGDCQIPLACAMFVEKHGVEVIRRRLYKNFVLHMCSMYDFGLTSAVVIFRTIRQLQDVAESMANGEVISSEFSANSLYFSSERPLS